MRFFPLQYVLSAADVWYNKYMRYRVVYGKKHETMRSKGEALLALPVKDRYRQAVDMGELIERLRGGKPRHVRRTSASIQVLKKV